MNIIDFANELEEKYIKALIDFCNIESPTLNKEGVDKSGEFIVNMAKELGFETEIHIEEVSGNAWCITMNPDAKGAPIALSGHLDTVHPVGLFGYPPTKIQGDKIIGPGVCDCKGGVVASLYAMEILSKVGFNGRPVILLLQSDEENSSVTSNKRTVQFMCEKAKDAVAFINCEGHDLGKIIVKRKGIIRYKLEVTGKAAHSSRCYLGASAITEAAHIILELEKYKDEDGITCNCGVISGGTVANTVAEKCSIIADFRFADEDDLEEIKRIVDEVSKKQYVSQTSCEYSLVSFRNAMALCDRNIELFNKINDAYEKNGYGKAEMWIGAGGSDAADVTVFGIPCVDCLGIAGDNIHSKDEFAYLNDLKTAALRLTYIIKDIEC